MADHNSSGGKRMWISIRLMTLEEVTEVKESSHNFPYTGDKQNLLESGVTKVTNVTHKKYP